MSTQFVEAASSGPAPIPSFPSHRAAWAYARLPDSGCKVLDFGCADGFHANLWTKRGNEVAGVDVKLEALSKARDRYPDIRFEASTGRLPFADATFDYVVMLDVIEHVGDERAVLREIQRVLRPGGRLLLTTPYRNLLGDWMDQENLVFQPAIKVKQLLKGRSVPFLRHRHYNLDDLKSLAGPGFEIERCETSGGPDTVALAFLAKSTALFAERMLRRSAAQVVGRIGTLQRQTHERSWGALAAKINIVLRRA